MVFKPLEVVAVVHSIAVTSNGRYGSRQEG